MNIQCNIPEVVDDLTLQAEFPYSSIHIIVDTQRDKYELAADIEKNGFSISGMSGGPKQWIDVYFKNIEEYKEIRYLLITYYDVKPIETKLNE